MLQIRKILFTYTRDTYLSEKGQVVSSDLPVIDCEIGYSPFGCSQWMLSNVGVGKIDFSAVARYPEMFYAELLKPGLIESFSKANLRPENIFFGHGSFNLAERIIHKFILPKSMLGYGPQFNEIPSEMEATGGLYRPIPLKEKFAFPLGEIIDELKTGCHSMLYIDNPNNPTGLLILIEVLRQLISVAESVGTIVLIDEAYGDFVPNECSAFNIAREYSNVMVMRSFSKALGLAAQRVGYMAISDALIQYYSKVDVPFEPTLISAHMAKLTLEDRLYITQVRELTRGCKAIIELALKQAGIEILPTHPDVSILMAHKPGVNLFSHFQKMSIKVENGVAYARTNSSMNNSFVRIRVPNQEQTEEVVQRIQAHDFSR